MDHATCSRLITATHFATSLLPLTARLLPVITEFGRLIVHSRRADPTPGACHRFETRLQELLRELGRIIVEWTLNHLEPHDRKDLPAQMGVPIAAEQKTTIFQVTVVQRPSRKRWFLRTAKNLRRVREILRDLDSR
jgi:hypothetical protein